MIRFQLISLLLLFIPALILPATAFAQLERERVVTDQTEELVFLSSRNINLYSVTSVSKGELHSSIMHSFGEVSTGVDGFWGLDSGASVRFSLEYGISDRVSVALGRSRINKVVDLSGRAVLTRQTRNGTMPLSVSLTGSTGINTDGMSFLADRYSFNERLNYAVSLPLARKISDKLSVQFTPILVHFTRVGTELLVADPTVNTYYSVGMGGRYLLTPRTSVSIQYIPALADAKTLGDNVAIGMNFNTGGHVFQMFFTTSQGLTEQYTIAAPNGNFFDREFRLGFNINRVFQLIGE